MNLSGESVKQLVRKYCDSTEELIVVYDDADLPWEGCASARKAPPARTTGCAA